MINIKNNKKQGTPFPKTTTSQIIREQLQISPDNENRRSSIKIMKQLIGLVAPLLHIMSGAIILGVAGYLCAIFLTILAAQVLIHGLNISSSNVLMKSNMFLSTSVTTLFIVMVILAVLRGVLHYIEQYCNHFIAFKLLAIIRHKVFAALRKLCPAKLEGRDRGNLISIITTDIELLEVFYAHTISPIAIAFLTSIIMIIFMCQYHIYAGILALISYLTVGIAIPLWNGRHGQTAGMKFRTEFGDLNSFILDSLRGLNETIQYGQGANREAQMEKRSESLSKLQQKLSHMEGFQRSFTNFIILVTSFGMLFLTLYLYRQNNIGFDGVLTCTIAMMGSFGPVVALSNLSNNLNQTLASGERVLSILEEKPIVEEIPVNENISVPNIINDTIHSNTINTDNTTINNTFAKNIDNHNSTIQNTDRFLGVSVEQISFSYATNKEAILNDYSLCIEPNQIIGIHGASGSGKSTLLKLLMRFWDIDSGKIIISEHDIKSLPTKYLRDISSYVTQETHLFHDSIANNIAIGKPNATREEIIEAAKKASIHKFIMTLPNNYDTEVGELGDTLSGGERQRIGIARAFLHDAPFILLDEPTSNLDSLNESIILKSLKHSCNKKTVVLVSHRKSTMNIADITYSIETKAPIALT